MTKFNYAKNYIRGHKTNPKWWSGSIAPDNVDAIAELVKLTGAKKIADYGSGKGYQYLADRIHDRWGGVLPYCFDIGVGQLTTPLMPGAFDGVICTDVMEHIAKEDIREVLESIFILLRRDREVFAYFNIFCNPAGKEFDDGTNVHLTVEPPDWWEKQYFEEIRRHERLRLRVDYEYVCGDDYKF